MTYTINPKTKMFIASNGNRAVEVDYSKGWITRREDGTAVGNSTWSGCRPRAVFVLLHFERETPVVRGLLAWLEGARCS